MSSRLVGALLASLLSACLWYYSLSYWLPYFNIASHANLVVCIIIGLIPRTGYLDILVAIITWIVSS